MAAKRRKGDATQPEETRKNPQAKYRLPADVAQEIADYAEVTGASRSTVVALAWRLARESGQLDGALLIALRAGDSKKD